MKKLISIFVVLLLLSSIVGSLLLSDRSGELITIHNLKVSTTINGYISVKKVAEAGEESIVDLLTGRYLSIGDMTITDTLPLLSDDMIILERKYYTESGLNGILEVMRVADLDKIWYIEILWGDGGPETMTRRYK